MAVPQSRSDFGQWILRKLGAPVIQVNVSEEQLDDRIDEALTYFQDYHFEGTELVYFKYLVQQNNFPTSIYQVNVVSNGVSYSNSDTFQFVETNPGGDGGFGRNTINAASNGTILTNGNGNIVSVSFPNNGSGYPLPPNVVINTSTGSGGSLTAELGGFVALPNTIIAVVDMFDIGLAESSVNNIFNIRYQIALNDLYMLNNLWMPDYYIARQNISLIEEVLVGKEPIRFNRYKNRVYIDMDWAATTPNSYLVFYAYAIVDPNAHTGVWADRYLQRYATCLVKLQWGENLKKFGNLPMPGGVVFNGQEIWNEAQAEKVALEEEMLNSWSLPPAMMLG